jgi:hypothetical protein
MRGPWIAAAMLVAAGAAASGGGALATPPDHAERGEAIRQAAAERLGEPGQSAIVEGDARVEICMNGACVVHRCAVSECAPPAPAPVPMPAAPPPVPAAAAAVDLRAAASGPRRAGPTARLRADAARALLARRGMAVRLGSDRPTKDPGPRRRRHARADRPAAAVVVPAAPRPAGRRPPPARDAGVPDR